MGCLKIAIPRRIYFQHLTRLIVFCSDLLCKQWSRRRNRKRKKKKSIGLSQSPMELMFLLTCDSKSGAVCLWCTKQGLLMPVQHFFWCICNLQRSRLSSMASLPLVPRLQSWFTVKRVSLLSWCCEELESTANGFAVVSQSLCGELSATQGLMTWKPFADALHWFSPHFWPGFPDCVMLQCSVHWRAGGRQASVTDMRTWEQQMGFWVKHSLSYSATLPHSFSPLSCSPRALDASCSSNSPISTILSLQS